MNILLIGSDGSGKTELAKKLIDEYKASYIHATYNKDMNVYKHHANIRDFVIEESKWQMFVMDRLAPCEFVYGTIYRNGPAFDTIQFMQDFYEKAPFLIIYCKPEINNYGADGREEMFENRTDEVNELYEKWLAEANLPYKVYDWVNDDWRQLID